MVVYRKHNNKNSMPKTAQRYKCGVCNKIFNSISKARIHISIHTTNSATMSKQKVLKQPMVQTTEGKLLIMYVSRIEYLFICTETHLQKEL